MEPGQRLGRWLTIGAAVGLGVLLLVVLIGGDGVTFGIGWQELVIVLLIAGVLLLAAVGLGGERTFRLRQWAPLRVPAVRDHAVR